MYFLTYRFSPEFFLAQVIQKGTQLSNYKSRNEHSETKSKAEILAFLLVPFGPLYVVPNSSNSQRGFCQTPGR